MTTKNQKFYPILTKFIGPVDEHNWGSTRDHGTITIYTEPGRTNSSHQIKTSGWLGTTNDYAEHALGEADSLNAARQICHDQGFTVKDIDDEYKGINEVETWAYPELSKVSAADWLVSDYETRAKITSKTTDDELMILAEELETECKTETGEGYEYGIELMHTMEFLKTIRDDKKYECD